MSQPKYHALRLWLCGAAILCWELLLIRWLGSCIRVVAYYTNFILASTFLGLGAGALLVRFRKRTWHGLVYLLCLSVLLGPLLGGLHHQNPTGTDEDVWMGSPRGILSIFGVAAPWSHVSLPYWIVLAITYLVNTGVFLMFGQWVGSLFRAFPPLKAYTIEICGSLLGIVLFAAMSSFQWPPPVWVVVGLLLVLGILEVGWYQRLAGTVLAVFTVALLVPFSNHYLWSRYYKIRVEPLTEIVDLQTGRTIQVDRSWGSQVAVNNDYHQLILDLRPRFDDSAFLQSWRWTYEYPYSLEAMGPPGPLLIVGAGTGNDVAAALRSLSVTTSRIDAVEIDPRLVELGRRYHPEQPFASERVRIIVDDARSFFARTDTRYAKVVFGFLDSHTLLSSWSSIRLDNFVYTQESMQRVKDLLLPGGKVFLIFATNTEWMHQRFVALLDRVFDYPTRVVREAAFGYSNASIYINGKAPEPHLALTQSTASSVRIPTDDWPFLYMRHAALPPHYQAFMALTLLLGVGALFLLPPGQRQVQCPYFFLGAGFFLIETSNVVSLSLLYGSTWVVNVAVFIGMLAFILLGNLTCFRMRHPRYPLLFLFLGASVLVAYATPTTALFHVPSKGLRGLLAVTIFLGPVYLASLIFGHLIKRESRFYQAYGSNLLGAVVGGCCEYLSILTGLKSLLLLTLSFYVLAFCCHSPSPKGLTLSSVGDKIAP